MHIPIASDIAKAHRKSRLSNDESFIRSVVSMVQDELNSLPEDLYNAIDIKFGHPAGGFAEYAGRIKSEKLPSWLEAGGDGDDRLRKEWRIRWYKKNYFSITKKDNLSKQDLEYSLVEGTFPPLHTLYVSYLVDDAAGWMADSEIYKKFRKMAEADIPLSKAFLMLISEMPDYCNPRTTARKYVDYVVSGIEGWKSNVDSEDPLELERKAMVSVLGGKAENFLNRK